MLYVFIFLLLVLTILLTLVFVVRHRVNEGLKVLEDCDIPESGPCSCVDHSYGSSCLDQACDDTNVAEELASAVLTETVFDALEEVLEEDSGSYSAPSYYHAPDNDSYSTSEPVKAPSWEPSDTCDDAGCSNDDSDSSDD